MTGAFLRVEREGKWENIEVEHLTESELDEIIGSRSKSEIMDWLKRTCKVLVLAEEHIAKIKEIYEESN